MKTTLLAPFALFLALGSGEASRADAWDEVFAQGGLTREQIRFDPLDQAQYGGAEKIPPYFLPLHGDPLRIPFYARIFRESALNAAEKPDDLVIAALAKLGLGIRRTLAGEPLEDERKRAAKPDGLVGAFRRIYRLAGKRLKPAEEKRLRAKIEAIPAQLRTTVAYLLEVEGSAYEWRQKAFARLLPSRAAMKALFADRMRVPKLDGEDYPDGATPALRELMDKVDMPYLATGGIDLVHGVAQAVAKLKELKPEPGLDERFAFDWATPLGIVAIHGAQDDVYAGGQPYLLIVDTGGNDTYYSGGASFDAERPIGVLIDLQGNDRYLALPSLGKTPIEAAPERKMPPAAPLFGAGIMGYGVLVDLGGDDLYASFSESQGRGNFGIGLLWDASGNDVYRCYARCQGSAEFGAGVLLDGAGSDRYDAFLRAQGFGGIFGAGLLLDAGKGDDAYAANNSTIDFPALVDPKQNTSFTQGAACGLRADVVDGHSLSGGFGALVDGGGNNSFSAGFFAQGIAYWYGVGLLSVGSGNDRYYAGKYAQGAATHFGVGILHDVGGDDSYKIGTELGLGEGHDWGVGFFIDDAGNDKYEAPNLSLGCASANGIGIFWDRAGDDEYIAPESETMGCASYRGDALSLRLRAPTIGVFLDTGGKNTFRTAMAPGAPLALLGVADRGSRKRAVPLGAVASESWRNASVGPSGAKLIGVGRATDQPQTADPQ